MVGVLMPRWLAILACLFASAVPAAGLVVCIHDGEFEVGLGDDCPCELPEDHPECQHFELDGGGDLVAAPPRIAPRVECASVTSGAGPLRPQDSEREARGGRAPPDALPGHRGRRAVVVPWIERHLRSRRTTSLLV